MTNARFHALKVKTLPLLISSVLFIPYAAPGQQTIHVPSDAATIQQAINEASDGDTVSISPGTYYENIDFKGKAITVTGSATASATILDGQARAATVTFKSKEGRNSVLSNLTIQNGAPTVQPEGGGVFIDGASPSILNNVIQNNIGCGIGSLYGGPLIEGNTITGTSIGKLQGCVDPTTRVSYGKPAMGTAIFIAETPQSGLQPQVIANDVHNNVASLSPGGILLLNSEIPLIENNLIYENSSDEFPALEVFEGGAPVIIQNLIFANKDDSSKVQGYVSTGTASVGLGVFTTSSTPEIFANNTVANNIDAPAEPMPVGSQISIDGDYGTLVFSNNIVVASGPITLINCYDPGSSSVLHADHNDVFMVGGGTLYQGTCSDPTGSNGNISTDPLFVSSTPSVPQDFQLQRNSPAIDSGNNNVPDLPSEDLAGNARIQDANGLSTAVIDMGVYEYPGSAAPPAPADFTLSISPASLSLTNGQQGNIQVILTPNVSFQGAVSLACGNLPSNISCTFQPSQVSLGNSFPQTAQLTISVNSVPASARHSTTSFAAFVLPESLLSLFLLSRRKSFPLRGMPVLLMLAGLSIFIAACGVTANATPQTANIEVYGTANSGKTTHQASFTLNVAPVAH